MLKLEKDWFDVQSWIPPFSTIATMFIFILSAFYYKMEAFPQLLQSRSTSTDQGGALLRDIWLPIVHALLLEEAT